MHGASEQCIHATEIDFSPGTPSLRVTTLRRFTPHGISCSCLHAVTQPLHSMHRSASHRNFILAIVGLLRLLTISDMANRPFPLNVPLTPERGARMRDRALGIYAKLDSCALCLYHLAQGHFR